MIQHSRFPCGIWLSYIMVLKWYKYPIYPPMYVSLQCLTLYHVIDIHIHSSWIKPATTTVLWWHKIYRCSLALVNGAPGCRVDNQHPYQFMIPTIYNPTQRSLHISSKWRRMGMVRKFVFQYYWCIILICRNPDVGWCSCMHMMIPVNVCTTSKVITSYIDMSHSSARG